MALRDRTTADRLRTLRRLAGPVEVALVLRSGRSLLSMAFRTPVLVLGTTGRRTGASRATVLAFHRVDERTLLVVGGAGGQRAVPDWVANLRAHPDAWVSVDRASRAVRATELAGAERAAAWANVRRVWPRIERYERRAGREVPVFRLDLR